MLESFYIKKFSAMLSTMIVFWRERPILDKSLIITGKGFVFDLLMVC